MQKTTRIFDAASLRRAESEVTSSHALDLARLVPGVAAWQDGPGGIPQFTATDSRPLADCWSERNSRVTLAPEFLKGVHPSKFGMVCFDMAAVAFIFAIDKLLLKIPALSFRTFSFYCCSFGCFAIQEGLYGCRSRSRSTEYQVVAKAILWGILFAFLAVGSGPMRSSLLPLLFLGGYSFAFCARPGNWDG